MYSIDRTSPVPIDNHSLMSNETETEIETSTPELNLLLDKLTEILRFRSSCRRHFGPQQQQQSNPSPATNLKRLQSGSIEPLHNNNNNNNNNTEGASTGAWKSSTSNRSSNHQHHSNNDKKRRLPSLLQRLIDEGNLIKEAVRRLKSQRFTHSFKQHQHPQTHIANTPSTPTTKSSSQTLPNVKLSSASINIPQQISDPPTQTTSSPNRGISWFLSSSVFGTTNHSSGSGSPLRNCCSSSTHDRTPMEIGTHDG
ncbi:unnamed protein product [Rotaria sordida]|uniref:Uncharacterized protein n=1 Tax=Rotaria sordida TaxID=392033 RepID=A0A814MG93_9BILA|nr:unnamed protein product [Rotaria sordida]CAF1086600.1 unnamed protein product [Rotaria sordida]CAF1101117.1 unnamed protein product [Rotaria sordida]CAF1149453.1 unnamed protein product [Rotaria sordida]CAF1278265.1 unnamed protein product [Rotaria sordida]